MTGKGTNDQEPSPTVILETIGTYKSSETFTPTTYSQYALLKSTLTTSIEVPGGQTVRAVMGPGGLAWHIPSVDGGAPEPFLPTFPPLGGLGGAGGGG
ncbi:hypothetical protein ABVK25_001019 [Lepraria finkii]|uniref:Uncharacterized protein n=1 Tax=Lepraria finkii TaxID=1340010 RepID=A0ABR4BKT2_9LECA